jgi:uncharacterized membrane protein
MTPDLLVHISDAVALAFSVGLLLAYHAFMWVQERRAPGYGVRPFLLQSRAAWVDRMMESGEALLAVQTVRNQIMVATFFASTAVLLIIGTLTLSVQGEQLAATWSAVSPFGAVSPGVFLGKVLVLLADLVIGFAAFSLTIRQLTHASMLIALPPEPATKAQVVGLFRQAALYQMTGMNCYYYAMPLLAWLFGPIFLIVSSLGLITVLYHLHRSPAPT